MAWTYYQLNYMDKVQTYSTKCLRYNPKNKAGLFLRLISSGSNESFLRQSLEEFS